MENSLKHKRCLVLNKSWFPSNIASAHRSIRMALNGRSVIIHPETLMAYSFDEWVKKGVEDDDHIQAGSLTFDIPKIIVTLYYDKIHMKGLPLTHANMYKRDGYKCWYCGSSKNLTWDHVIPKSKGGKHKWNNVITCCFNCNNEKDNMDVEEFCQIKNYKVPKPISLSYFPWLIDFQNVPEGWRNFLK